MEQKKQERLSLKSENDCNNDNKPKFFISYFNQEDKNEFTDTLRLKNSKVSISTLSKVKNNSYDISKKDVGFYGYEKAWDRVIYQMLNKTDTSQPIEMNQLIRFFQAVLIQNGYKDSEQFKYISEFKKQKRMIQFSEALKIKPEEIKMIRAEKKHFGIQCSVDNESASTQTDDVPQEVNIVEKPPIPEVMTSAIDEVDKCDISSISSNETVTTQQEVKHDAITENDINIEHVQLNPNLTNKTNDGKDIDDNSELTSASSCDESDQSSNEFKEVQKKVSKRSIHAQKKKNILEDKGYSNDEVSIEETPTSMINTFEALSSGAETTDIESESEIKKDEDQKTQKYSKRIKRSIIKKKNQAELKAKKLAERAAYLDVKEDDITSTLGLRLYQKGRAPEIDAEREAKNSELVPTKDIRLFSLQEFPIIDNPHTIELHEDIAKTLSADAPLSWKEQIAQQQITVAKRRELIKQVNLKTDDDILQKRIQIAVKYCNSISLTPYLPYRNQYMVLNNMDLKPLKYKQCNGESHECYAFHQFVNSKQEKPEAFIPLFSYTNGCASAIDPNVPNARYPTSIHIGKIPCSVKTEPNMKSKIVHIPCVIVNSALAYIFSSNHAQTIYLLQDTPSGGQLPFEAAAYFVVGKKTLDNLAEDYEKALIKRIQECYDIKNDRYDGKKLHENLNDYFNELIKNCPGELLLSKDINSCGYELKKLLSGRKVSIKPELIENFAKLFNVFDIYKKNATPEEKGKFMDRVFDNLGRLSHAQQTEFVTCIEKCLSCSGSKKGSRGCAVLQDLPDSDDFTCKCRISDDSYTPIKDLKEVIYHPCMLHAFALGSGLLPSSSDDTRSKADTCGSCHARYPSPILASLCFARCVIEKTYERQHRKLILLKKEKSLVQSKVIEAKQTAEKLAGKL